MERSLFSLVVLVTLGLFGLVGVVLLQPDLIGGLLGQNMVAHISQHFREPHHRIHDLAFSLLVGTAAVGMLVQLQRPLENVAGQLMALIPWIALLLASALTMTPVRFAPFPILAAFTLIAAVVHPAGRDLFRSLSFSRMNQVMLALVIVAAAPLLALAYTNTELQRTVTDDHAALGHYGFMVAFSITVIGAGLLASLRPDGWRLTAWVAGLLPVLLGLASIVFPDVVSSLDLIWALVAFAWGIVFVATAEIIRHRGRTHPGRAGQRSDNGSTTGTSRWVYVFGVIAITTALLFAIMHLSTGGLRGHTP